VKGYQQFEAGLLTNITALRSGWINANSTADKIQSGNALDSALGRLLVTYENYPTLQSAPLVQSIAPASGIKCRSLAMHGFIAPPPVFHPIWTEAATSVGSPAHDP
jgi:hypothetical protein